MIDETTCPDVVSLLFDPDAFFEEYVGSPELLRPAALVLVVALLTGVKGYLTFTTLQRALPPEMQGISAIFLLSTIGGSLIGPFLMWLVFTALFYGISLAFDSEGSFKRTFGAVGWGFLPGVAHTLISIAFTYAALQGITVPQGGGPEVYATFARRLQSDPLLRLSGLIGVVFTLWQGLIWTYGLRHARSLELRNATISVGVPVGLLVLWNLYSLL